MLFSEQIELRDNEQRRLAELGRWLLAEHFVAAVWTVTSGSYARVTIRVRLLLPVRTTHNAVQRTALRALPRLMLRNAVVKKPCTQDAPFNDIHDTCDRSRACRDSTPVLDLSLLFS